MFGPTCLTGVTVDPTPAASFFAFDPAFTGGVYVAVGNFDPSNDPTTCKRHEIVVAAGEGGGPHVKIFRNQTTGGGTCPSTPLVLDVANPIVSFLAFDPAFTGGVRVAAGDLNDDGFAELVVGAGPGGGPHVVAFRNLSAGAVFGPPGPGNRRRRQAPRSYGVAGRRSGARWASTQGPSASRW